MTKTSNIKNLIIGISLLSAAAMLLSASLAFAVSPNPDPANPVTLQNSEDFLTYPFGTPCSAISFFTSCTFSDYGGGFAGIGDKNPNTNEYAKPRGGATSVAGKVGRAFSFDGFDDYAEASVSTNLQIGSALTIEAWVKPDALKNYAGVVSKNIAGLGGQYTYMAVVHGDGSLGMYSPSSNWQFSSPGVVPSGVWSHVAWVWDGSTVKFYVNGALVGTQPMVILNNFPAHTVKFGRWYTLLNDYVFDGFIDEVRIYNLPLSPSQIQDSFNGSPSAGAVAEYTADKPVFITAYQTGAYFNLDSLTRGLKVNFLKWVGRNTVLTFTGPNGVITSSALSVDTGSGKVILDGNIVIPPEVAYSSSGLELIFGFKPHANGVTFAISLGQILMTREISEMPTGASVGWSDEGPLIKEIRLYKGDTLGLPLPPLTTDLTSSDFLDPINFLSHYFFGTTMSKYLNISGPLYQYNPLTNNAFWGLHEGAGLLALWNGIDPIRAAITFIGQEINTSPAVYLDGVECVVTRLGHLSIQRGGYYHPVFKSLSEVIQAGINYTIELKHIPTNPNDSTGQSSCSLYKETATGFVLVDQVVGYIGQSVANAVDGTPLIGNQSFGVGFSTSPIDTTIVSAEVGGPGSIPPDTTPPTASLTTPLDNGPADADPALKSVLASTTLSAFVVQLADNVGGSGINDSTVTAGTVSLTKNGTLLTQGVDYTFSYDAASDQITLTSLPASSSFLDGSYSIAVSEPDLAIIKDNAGNALVDPVFAITIDTTPPTVTKTDENKDFSPNGDGNKDTTGIIAITYNDTGSDPHTCYHIMGPKIGEIIETFEGTWGGAMARGQELNARGIRECRHPKEDEDTVPEGTVGVAIFDQGGNLIKTLLTNQPVTGVAAVFTRWDGKDAAGNVVPDGEYTNTATARDKAGNFSTAVQPVTVDTVAPNLIGAKGDPVIFAGLNVSTITATANEDVAWKMTISDKNGIIVNQQEAPLAQSTSFIWDGRNRDSSFALGNNKLAFELEDRAGNRLVINSSLTITVVNAPGQWKKAWTNTEVTWTIDDTGTILVAKWKKRLIDPILIRAMDGNDGGLFVLTETDFDDREIARAAALYLSEHGIEGLDLVSEKLKIVLKNNELDTLVSITTEFPELEAAYTSVKVPKTQLTELQVKVRSINPVGSKNTEYNAGGLPMTLYVAGKGVANIVGSFVAAVKDGLAYLFTLSPNTTLTTVPNSGASFWSMVQRMAKQGNIEPRQNDLVSIKAPDGRSLIVSLKDLLIAFWSGYPGRGSANTAVIADANGASQMAVSSNGGPERTQAAGSRFVSQTTIARDPNGNDVKVNAGSRTVKGSEFEEIWPEELIVGTNYWYGVTPDTSWDWSVVLASLPAGCTADKTSASEMVSNGVKTLSFNITCSDGTARINVVPVAYAQGGPQNKGQAVVNSMLKDCNLPNGKCRTIPTHTTRPNVTAGKKGSPPGQSGGNSQALPQGGSLWGLVKSRMNGASNDAIKAAVKKLAEHNDIAIPEWNLTGRVDHRKLLAGTLINLVSLSQ